MCHHLETREWTALREALDESELDGGDDESPAIEPDERTDTEERQPSIQPTA